MVESMTTRMASVESMAARMIAGMTSHGVGMVGRMITRVKSIASCVMPES